MTLEVLFEAIAVMLTLVGWVVAGIVAHKRATKDEIKKINDRIDALGETPAGIRDVRERLDGVEKEFHDNDKTLIAMRERLKAAPGHDDLQTLHDRIGRLSESQTRTREDVAKLLEAVSGVRRAVDRLHDHHLTGEAKSRWASRLRCAPTRVWRSWSSWRRTRGIRSTTSSCATPSTG